MSFDLGNGTAAINTILAEEANRIGSDIYSRTLHTSPWLDLTKQTAFADGMGFQQTTLVYDRAITTDDSSGNSAGATWSNIGQLNETANNFGTGLLKDTASDVNGARDARSYVQFNKSLKKYNLERAVIESPRISLEDLRFAAHRQEQLRAIMAIMTQVTRNTWENRYRDEFDKVAANLTLCLAAGSKTVSTIDVSASTEFEGVSTVSVDLNNDFVSSGVDVDYTPDANISNAVLDGIYYQLIRAGAGSNSYGRENGRPVFGLVLSSEASYQIQTEAGFRDDVRYNNAKVSDLIAPLGIEKSFRGFYHLVDDLAPRYTVSSGTLTRVDPYNVVGGKATPNPDYETATHESAFLVHPEVCEAQIPNPMSGGAGITFDPVNYRGKFDWKNIAHEQNNPDGTIGFFRGVLASATKPIKTEFGYVILFKRDSSTPAA
jgi:hypothetical protein